MGFYSRVIFPRLMDWSMAGPDMAKYRQEVLAQVQGEVLEIGFGTGLNLPYYPKRIRKITTVDPNPGVNQLAQKRIQESSMMVDHRVLSGEQLPMADNTFDSVVSTWTLCSIANVDQAIQEIYRVLKPGGRFFFIEHGLSEDPGVQIWQHRLNPIQKVIGDGCHLDRDIQTLIKKQFQDIEIEQFDMENAPKTLGHLYRGVATKT
jgi:ubiquinone/menaquinone biosynthesis C-methylase UbiE